MEYRRPIRFEIRLPAELADRIDDWRRDVPALPARATAARKLIELGLAAYKFTQAQGELDLERAKSELLAELGRARTARGD
jgi:hypothetical protein